MNWQQCGPVLRERLGFTWCEILGYGAEKQYLLPILNSLMDHIQPGTQVDTRGLLAFCYQFSKKSRTRTNGLSSPKHATSWVMGNKTPFRFQGNLPVTVLSRKSSKSRVESIRRALWISISPNVKVLAIYKLL